MAPPPFSRRILSGSHHRERDPDYGSAGMVEPAAEGQRRHSTGKQEAGRRPEDRGLRSECTGQSCLVVSPRLARI
jgi:hypothetical protein